MSVVFITCNEAAEVLEPANRALDLPASSVAAELPAVLRGRLLAVHAMRAHEFNAALAQPCTQRIAVGCQIVNQPPRLVGQNPLFEQRFDQCHFVRAGAGDLCAEGQTTAIGEDHDLATLAALRLPYTRAPFFA